MARRPRHAAAAAPAARHGPASHRLRVRRGPTRRPSGPRSPGRLPRRCARRRLRHHAARACLDEPFVTPEGHMVADFLSQRSDALRQRLAARSIPSPRFDARQARVILCASGRRARPTRPAPHPHPPSPTGPAAPNGPPRAGVARRRAESRRSEFRQLMPKVTGPGATRPATARRETSLLACSGPSAEAIMPAPRPA